MQQIADAGFGTMICNRPDGEEPGQPTVSSVRDAAEAAGIAFHHIPVSGGEFPEVAIKAFAKVREEADGKVLAFCRTGTRSITLDRSEEHTSELQSLMRISYAVFCLKKKNKTKQTYLTTVHHQANSIHTHE